MINPERLKASREAAGLTQSELARRVGISSPSVNRLETGETKDSRKINDIAYVLGTTEAYLTGKTDDPAAGALPRPSVSMIAEELDIVEIPQLDLRFGMGGGAVYDAPVVAEQTVFSRAWVRQFTSAPEAMLVWARGVGDSMYPTIGDGDTLLIDRSQNAPTMSDQVWAITQYGHGMIKRLRPTENGYRILSDNPTVPPDVATDGSMSIVGRVIAVVRRI